MKILKKTIYNYFMYKNNPYTFIFKMKNWLILENFSINIAFAV